ncbi:hypothetical protein Peur_039502 [Populus x canadensis]|jgi:hypothetical protein
MTIKSNIVEGSSHKKGMKINSKVIISPMVTILICSNPNLIILRKRETVLYMTIITIMYLNAEKSEKQQFS